MSNKMLFETPSTLALFSIKLPANRYCFEDKEACSGLSFSLSAKFTDISDTTCGKKDIQKDSSFDDFIISFKGV